MKTKLLTEIVCTKCGETKLADEFRLRTNKNDRGYVRTYREQPCKKCRMAYNNAWSRAKKALAKALRPPKPPKPPRLCKCGAPLEKWHQLCDACAKGNSREYRRKYQRERMQQLRQDAEYAKKDRERLRKWLSDNPDYKQTKRHKNKEIRRGLPATLTVSEWRQLLADFGNRCAYCGEMYERLQQDHFIPASQGGGLVKDNILPACYACNNSKGDKMPYDWLARRPGGKERYQQLVIYLGL